MSPIHPPKKKDKRASERLRLTTFRLRVFVWDERLGEVPPASGFGFVSEFSNTGVGFYVNEEIKAGSPVRVAFESETGVAYRANVVWSNRVSLTQKFVGHEALAYRAGVRLLFASEAERQRYLKFLDELKLRAGTIEPGMRF